MDYPFSMSYRVITYDPKYLEDFVSLNREWIEKYFAIEESDRQQLLRAKENILDVGGEIFFILEDGKAVATCAMVPHGGKFELAKMAVTPSARGKGYGDILMETAIQWSRERGLNEIFLLSNTILEPAISLYKKHGFVTVNLGPHPDYERCNIEMNLKLK